jgi:Concanavalin A-like lectin/glucanases superfamily
VATGITSVATGVWMHFAATYSPTLHRLKEYLNGKKVADQSGYTLAGENTAPLLIAESGTCGYTFPGNMDEVCILRQALSGSQIADLYHGLPCNEVS